MAPNRTHLGAKEKSACDSAMLHEALLSWVWMGAGRPKVLASSPRGRAQKRAEEGQDAGPSGRSGEGQDTGPSGRSGEEQKQAEEGKKGQNTDPLE